MDRIFELERLRCGTCTDMMDPICRGLHGDRQCQVIGNKQMFAAAYTSFGSRILQILFTNLYLLNSTCFYVKHQQINISTRWPYHQKVGRTANTTTLSNFNLHRNN